MWCKWWRVLPERSQGMQEERRSTLVSIYAPILSRPPRRRCGRTTLRYCSQFIGQAGADENAWFVKEIERVELEGKKSFAYSRPALLNICKSERITAEAQRGTEASNAGEHLI